MKQDIKKIVIIGPESTGKSTLSKQLAQELRTVWVQEYAREYLEQRDGKYTYEDLLQIAKGQIGQEEKLVSTAKEYLICDTDLYVLKVWSEHKYGKTHAFILEEIATRNYDAYILCNIDLDWAPDPLREHAEPEMRSYFYNIYKDIVLSSGKTFTIVSGSEQDRLEQALHFLKNETD